MRFCGTLPYHYHILGSLRYIKPVFELSNFLICIREDGKPTIVNSDCNAKICKLCRARSATLTDECDNISTDGNTFYVMVVTHEPHQDGTVTFRGLTLTKVETNHVR